MKATKTLQPGGEDGSTPRLRMGSSLSYEDTMFDGSALILKEIHGIEDSLKELSSVLAKQKLKPDTSSLHDDLSATLYFPLGTCAPWSFACCGEMS